MSLTKALRAILEYDEKSLESKSTHQQDIVMNACSFSSMNVLKFALENIPQYDFDQKDNWGFTSLTFSIKNNFLVGLIYMIKRGADLNSDIKDVNGCTYLHWACFMDRLFVLGMLFRGGFDFQVIDKTGSRPWDRAMENWSIFALNFMLDYSHRSLKTMYFLKGKTSFPELDLLPQEAKLKAYEVKSSYIAKQMRQQRRIREGVYGSLKSLLAHSYGYFILEYVSYNWYKFNIPSYYWLKVYLCFLVVLAYRWYGEVQAGQGEVGRAYFWGTIGCAVFSTVLTCVFGTVI